MNRLLYEKSISHCGYLIIPFAYRSIEKPIVYSYTLLSDRGWKGKFHNVENPAGLYGDSIEAAIAVAREHLYLHSDSHPTEDPFKERYIYRNHLFILYEQGGKCFYDHYPPETLKNLAAPKIFSSKVECIRWITEELTRRTPQPNSIAQE